MSVLTSRLFCELARPLPLVVDAPLGIALEDASHRVADVDVATRLTALAVHGQRMFDGGLDPEAIQHLPNTSS